MRLLLAAALLLLPLSTVYAQTEVEAEPLTAEEQELEDGMDVVLFCATAFAMATQAPGVPEDKVAQYDQQSVEMFEVAVEMLTAGGVDEAGIDTISEAYLEEVTQTITAGEELRLSEEQCQAGYDAMSEL